MISPSCNGEEYGIDRKSKSPLLIAGSIDSLEGGEGHGGISGEWRVERRRKETNDRTTTIGDSVFVKIANPFHIMRAVEMTVAKFRA